MIITPREKTEIVNWVLAMVKDAPLGIELHEILMSWIIYIQYPNDCVKLFIAVKRCLKINRAYE